MSEQSARCVYPNCDCDGPEGPACGLLGYAELMNRSLEDHILDHIATTRIVWTEDVGGCDV